MAYHIYLSTYENINSGCNKHITYKYEINYNIAIPYYTE